MNNELQHHGILGQKWGVRRFQNYDGTLTARGKKRELKSAGQYSKVLNKNAQRIAEEEHALSESRAKLSGINKKVYRAQTKYDDTWLNENGSPKDPNWDGKTLPDNKEARRLGKLNTKWAKANNEVKTHEQRLQDGKKLTESLIKDAESKGFVVDSKDFIRLANPGEYYAMALLGAPVTAGKYADFRNSSKYNVMTSKQYGKKHAKERERYLNSLAKEYFKADDKPTTQYAIGKDISRTTAELGAGDYSVSSRLRKDRKGGRYKVRYTGK